jgi:transcriptional regulator with XRE-family HTH domain
LRYFVNLAQRYNIVQTCAIVLSKKITLCKEKSVEDIVKIEQGARLLKAFKNLGLSQVAVSELTGVSQPLLSQVCSGKRGMTRMVEFSIAEKLPSVNMRWVISGQGDMFLGGLEKKYEELPDGGGEVSEADGEYGSVDPLSALRAVLDEYGRRLAALEAEVAALRKDVKKT